MEGKEGITRRGFVTAAGSVALGAAVASVAMADEGQAAPATAMAGGDVPETWDYECDVLVLGAGGSGLATAYGAANAGAETLVLESQGSSTACTTNYCFGNFIVVDSDQQRDAGIEDKPENLLEDVRNNGNTVVTPTAETQLNEGLILKYAEQTRVAYETLSG